jgi:hypothetical protein
MDEVLEHGLTAIKFGRLDKRENKLKYQCTGKVLIRGGKKGRGISNLYKFYCMGYDNPNLMV